MPGDNAYDEAVERLDDVLDDIVDRRRGSIGTEDEGPMDFLSILLRARDRNEQSSEQLRDEMMTMLLAGHDTTALTLTYTWFLLSEHPEVQARLHEEIDEVVGDDRPSIEHVREFEYLDWVVDEAMRLYPPVYAIFRTPTEPVELDGYEVPPSANVMLSQWAVHHSDRHWEHPERFDPDRGRDRHTFAFFPFGGGPRHCIGNHLALLEAKLIVATVAGEYRLRFQGETPLELQPTLTAHPRQEMTMSV
jgi:cytochrome P450